MQSQAPNRNMLQDGPLKGYRSSAYGCRVASVANRCWGRCSLLSARVSMWCHVRTLTSRFWLTPRLFALAAA